MDRINCPDSDCWQRVTGGEERDEDICADHINKTIDFVNLIKDQIKRRIDMTNGLEEQQRAYRSMLEWIEKNEP